MAKSGLKFDMTLCLAVLCLVGAGVVLVASSSTDFAEAKHLPSSFYLAQHLKKVLIGFAAFLLALIVPFKTWEKLSMPLIVLSIAGLFFLVASGMAGRVNGARRWIQFASFGLQPSELAKLSLIFYLAKRLVEKESVLQEFGRGFLGSLLIPAVLFFLILKQPNYSTAASVLSITIAMIFVAGCRPGHLISVGIVGIPTLVGIMLASPYRMRRVMAFLNPDSNPASSYQSQQSLISLGHGGFLGTGLGSGTEKLGYLPMPFTDTVFSILGGELGFIGSIGTLLVFALVIWRGFSIADRCTDRFGSLVATGLSISIAVNVMMHVGVCVKLFPTTGQTLPFISYGGTSLLANLFGMGVLLNISGSTSGVSQPLPSKRAVARAKLSKKPYGVPGTNWRRVRT